MPIVSLLLRAFQSRFMAGFVLAVSTVYAISCFAYKDVGWGIFWIAMFALALHDLMFPRKKAAR